MPRTPEQRLKAVEETTTEIREILIELRSVLVFGQKPAVPGKAEFSRAHDKWLAGDHGPMNVYFADGGQIPEVPENLRRSYQPRKRAAHSLLPPETEANPADAAVVTEVLQDAKRGTLDRHRRTSRPEPSGNAYANAQRMGASGTVCTGSEATTC